MLYLFPTENQGKRYWKRWNGKEGKTGAIFGWNGKRDKQAPDFGKRIEWEAVNIIKDKNVNLVTIEPEIIIKPILLAIEPVYGCTCT